MTDIKNKPLSVIDAALDKEASYPPTNKSIFNPYTGGIIKIDSVDSIASSFSIFTGKTFTPSTVLLKDNVTLRLGIPTFIVRLKKVNTLYYKFRIFFSLSPTDFYGTLGNSSKETYCDVNLFTDITGTNVLPSLGYVAQTEVSNAKVLTSLLSLYTIDEIISKIDTIKNNTYTTLNDKVAAIYANLDFLQIYAQISPLTINPNPAGVDADYHNSYREPTLLAAQFTLIESGLSMPSLPTLSANKLKFSLKTKNIKSVKLKISLGNSAGTSATFLDSVTRVIKLDLNSPYVTLTTSNDGFNLASIVYPLENLSTAELDGGILFDVNKLTTAFNYQLDGLPVDSFNTNLLQLKNVIVEFESADSANGVVLTNLAPYFNGVVKYVLSMSALNAVNSIGKPAIIAQRKSNFIYVSNSSTTQSTRGAASLKINVNSSTQLKDFLGFLVVLKNAAGTLVYSKIFTVSEMVSTNTTQTNFSLSMPIDTAVNYVGNISIYSLGTIFSTSTEYFAGLPKITLSTLITKGNIVYNTLKNFLSFKGLATALPFEGLVRMRVTYPPREKSTIKTPVERDFSILPSLAFQYPTGLEGTIWSNVLVYPTVTFAFTIPSVNYSSSFINTNNLGSITWT
jgi:hypothetical protein